MHHTVYNISSCLVEIEDTRRFGNDGVRTTTWNWEITMAVHESVHKGKAIETRKGAVIEWVELQKGDILHEMIEHCKRFINQNP